MSRWRVFVHSGWAASLFVLGSLGGAVLHMGTPAFRRVVAARVSAALAQTFEGRLIIDRVGALDATGASGIDAHVEDGAGRLALHVSGVRARISTVALLRSLFGGKEIRIALADVGVDRAEVHIDGDGTDLPRIARAFQPRAPKTPSTPGPGVRLTIGHVRIGHATVLGAPKGAPAIDASIDGLGGAFAVTPSELSIDVTGVQLEARATPPDVAAEGVLTGHWVLPLRPESKPALVARWQGTVDAVAASVDLRWESGVVDLRVDAPEVSPEAIRALWKDSPIATSFGLHADAHGPLDRLDANARVSTGAGTIALKGPVTLGDEVRAALHLEARSIDAHSLVTSAPSSDVSASGDVSLAAGADGSFHGDATLDIAEGRVAALRFPPAHLTVSAAIKGTTTAVDAKLSVADPRAPTEVLAHLRPDGASWALAFDARTRVPSLGAIAGSTAVRGHASASVHGKLELGAARVEARIDAQAGDVDAGAVGLGSATISARVAGPLLGPRIDADVGGTSVRAGSFHFDHLHAESHGTRKVAPVTISLRGGRARVDASADVVVGTPVSLRNLDVAFEDDGHHARARAARVEIASEELTVDDAVVEGIGTPIEASLMKGPGVLRIRARSEAIDVERAAKLAHSPAPAGGRLRLDVDATLRERGARGRVLVDLTEGSVGTWRDAKFHLDAALDDRRVSGHASANLGDVGLVDAVSKDVQIGGAGALAAASWKRTFGQIDVTAHVDLAKLAAVLPKGTLTIAPRGLFDATARVERDAEDDATPEVLVDAKTSGLQIARPGPSPWTLAGVDGSLHAQVDGRTAATSVEASVTDGTGKLVAVTAKSNAVPYARLLGIEDGDVALALRTMPFEAEVAVPARDLRELPPALRSEDMRGTVEGKATWQGTVLQPAILVTATAKNARGDASWFAVPIDVDAVVRYDGSHASASVKASSKDKPMIDAQADADVRAADLVTLGLSAPEGVPWTGSAHADVMQLPLQSIGQLDDRQVHGRMNGHVEVSGLHQDARAKATFSLQDLSVGDVACKSAQGDVSVDGQALDFTARVDQADGFVATRGHVGMHWGARPAPVVDVSQPADVSLSANRFRAEILLPFLSAYFTELDGRVSGSANVQIDATARTLRPKGTLTLAGGAFELSSIGGEFHDVTAKLTATPDGVVLVDNISAAGLSGRLQAAASARISGMGLASARVLLQVPKKEPLPLVLDGVQMGTLDGRFDLEVARAASGPTSDGALDVRVDVPTLHVQLPLSSPHDVTTLGGIEGVRIGIQTPNTFIAAPLDGPDPDAVEVAVKRAPVRVAVHLGGDVVVSRGTDLQVPLEGDPSIVLGDTVTATGQIRLLRGSIDVQGKTFAIESGTVTFVGDDATNPQVVLTAGWSAPDGTKIYADFNGPLKTGKVTLRSEPARSQNEILALILFGTTDEQASNTSTSPSTNTAVGAAGGAATAPINRALGGVNRMLDNFGLGGGGISTKVDTSQTNPRPEVTVGIARDISFQIAWVLGVPPPGTNPDTTLYTLNWRFLRSWSMQMTRGDAGTSILDLVWRHRY